jgi:hypothetical protein
MENRIFGNLLQEGLEVVEREARYFVRYDAGSHNTAWREDEISDEELALLKCGKSGEYQTIIALQRRLQLIGLDPYKQNWVPGGA